MTWKKSVLFITATHGDEAIGVEAISEVNRTRSESVDFIIGNEIAYSLGTRCIEGRIGGDLNRSAPGICGSQQYHERRAWEILQIAKGYDWVVDLHGCSQPMSVFIILSKIDPQRLQLAARFDIPRILLWQTLPGHKGGALNASVDCGIEIECGPKDDPMVREKLVRTIKDFLISINDANCDWAEWFKRREVYTVVDSIPFEEKDQYPDLKEWGRVVVAGYTRYALFVGVYPHIHCLLLERLPSAQIELLCVPARGRGCEQGGSH